MGESGRAEIERAALHWYADVAFVPVYNDTAGTSFMPAESDLGKRARAALAAGGCMHNARKVYRHDKRDPRRIAVSNEELVTVRDAMRTLNQLVALLTEGKRDQYVLTRGGKIVAVLNAFPKPEPGDSA